MQNRMTTSQQQTSVNGEDEWMSSLEAFRASLSVTPGDEEARKMTAISGRTCSAALTKSDPLGSLLKMLLESSRWWSKARFLRWQVRELYSTRATEYTDTNSERPLPCNESATTLKVTDIPSSRCLYQLQVSEPPTDATESLLLQTPTTVQTDEPPEKMRARAERNGYKNGTKFGSLTSQIKYDQRVKGMLLPTPLVVEREHPERVVKLKAAGATQINSRVNGEQRPNGIIDFMQFYDLIPTPRANVVNGCDLENEKLANRNKSNLEEVVAKMHITMKKKYGGMLPTPTSTEWKGTFGPESVNSHNRDFLLRSLPTVIGIYGANEDGSTSQLSPLFTEEMMGFPYLWTTLPFLSENGETKHSKPTETPSSPK